MNEIQAAIDDFCLLYAKPDAPIKMGSWVHIVSFSSLTGGFVSIGDFVAVSTGSRIIAGSDHYGDGALMNSLIPEKFRNFRVKDDKFILKLIKELYNEKKKNRQLKILDLNNFYF